MIPFRHFHSFVSARPVPQARRLVYLKFVVGVFLILTIQMFLGIQFTASEGGTISLVHEKWLTPRKKEVWWPPHKSQDVFIRSLKKGESPNAEWLLFKIEKTIFQEENFQKASIKIKKAEDTSDVVTDFEEKLPLKRERRPNRKLFISSSSDDSDEEPPEKVRKINNGNIKSRNSTSWGNELPPNVELIHSKSSRSYDSNTKVLAVDSAVTAFKEYTPKENTPRSYLSISGDIVEDSSPSLIANTKAPPVYSADFQKTVLHTLLQIKEQNKKILNILEDGYHGVSQAKYFPPKDIPVKLPIQNLVDLDKIEEYLSVEKNLSALISYYETLGGRDKLGKTNNILRGLISNSVAAKFSFLGSRKQKRSFANLNLHLVSGLTDFTESWHISEIKGKYMILPYKDKFVSIPLFHTYSF